jgi:hypothetical protein
MVLPLAGLYSVEAQTVQLNYPDFAYVAVAPNPTGVGQPVTIVVWTAEMPPTTPLDNTLGSVGSRNAWTGWTITITDPNNKTETISLPPKRPRRRRMILFIYTNNCRQLFNSIFTTSTMEKHHRILGLQQALPRM